MYEDIAESKQAEEQIESLARFPAENPSPVLRIATDGTLLYANAASKSLLKEWKCQVGQAVGEWWLQRVSEAFESGGETRVETEYAGRTLAFAIAPVAEAGYANLYGRDITERKKVQNELAESAERFQRAVLESPFPIMIHAEDGEVLQINKVWTELTGYRSEEIPTLSEWTRLAYGERKDVVKSRIDKIFDCDTRVDEGEYVITSKKGVSLIWDFSSASLGRLPDGRRLVISIAKDVTEHKRAQEQIENLAKFPSENPNPVLRIARDGKLLYANDASESLLNEWNCQVGQIVGEWWRQRVSEAFESGSEKRVETEHAGRTLAFAIAPVAEAGYANLYGRDITESKRAREQIENLAKFPSENPNPVLRIARDGTLLYANEASKSLLKEWKCGVGQAVGECWRERVSEAFESGSEKRVETEHAGRTLAFAIAPVAETGYANLYGRDITDRKRAQEQIENLAKFPSENPNPVLRIARDGTLLYANDASQALLNEWNCRVGQVVGEWWRQRVSEAFESGSETTLEMGHTGRTYSFAIAPVAETGYANLYGRDITDRKRAEEIINESEQRFRDFFEKTPIGLHIFGPDQTITDINDAELDMIGYSREEIVGKKKWQDLVISAQREKFQKHWDDIITKGRIRDVEYTLVHKQGYHIDVILNASSRFGENGNLINTRGSVLDITERKKAEEELRQGRQKYELAQKAANFGTWEWDIATGKTRWLGQFESLFGFSPGKLEQTFDTFIHLVHPEDRKKVINGAEACIKKKGPSNVEYRITRPDGAVRWILGTSDIMQNPDDRPSSMYGIVQDITDRKQAEEALLRYASIVSSSSDMMAALDTNFVYVAANEAYLAAFGMTRDEVVGHTVSEVFGEEFFETIIRPNAEGCLEGNKIRYEKWFQFPVHGSRYMLATYSPYTGPNGDIRGFVVNAKDITERKEAEQEREQLLKTVAAKNRELQDIIYIASHDLKTPLVNILGFSGELLKDLEQLESLLVKDKLEESEKSAIENLLHDYIPQEVKFISSAGHMLKGLIDGMLQVSRIGSAEYNIEPINMNELIKEVVDGLEFSIRDSGVSVSVEELPNCLCDAPKTIQIFGNLINNALKYLDAGRKGVVRVRGRCENGRSEYCVQDNGIGIDAGHQAKVFEIFHRLNPSDDIGGEGLGLTIVVRILDQMEGTIRLESEPGKGSKFFVSLPST